MQINYRLLTASDADTYRQLRLKSYQEAPLAFSESYEDEKHKTVAHFEEVIKQVGSPPEWFILGAFTPVDKELIGFVKFRRDQRSKARHKAMVHAMYVDPAFRYQAVGKGLMLELFACVQKLQGLEQIHLWVLHSDGRSAADFYRKLGFISQGPVVRKDLKLGDRYIDAEYMVCYLQEYYETH